MLSTLLLLALFVASTALAAVDPAPHGFELIERGKKAKHPCKANCKASGKAKSKSSLKTKSKTSRQTTSVASLFANSPKTYPALDVPGPAPRPEWIKKYNAARAAKKIPAIPTTTIVDYNPVYPASYKGNPCSFYLDKCNATTDITTGPKGQAGISFDDGPQPPSLALLDFLTKQKIKATHFLIGSRIISNPTVFAKTVSSGGHLSVHTWSHPFMTTQNDNAVLGELGWTMQVIYDQSGKLPAFWRPPYGDVDNRVRAIAKEVFGLTTVTWSLDSRDWCLAASASGSACGVGDGPQSSAELNQELSDFVDKTPLQNGLIILEHEHGARPIEAFKTVFPALKKRWQLKAIPDLRGLKWYQ